MRIIPAIDIIGGKCVRLTKGDYQSMKIYNEDPLEVAKAFEDHGIHYLHLVDLDGAKAKSVVNYAVLDTICSHTSLHVDFGGGVKAAIDFQKVFDHGASQITGGSIAAKDRGLFLNMLDKYGPSKIILGADAKDKMIATDGWEEATTLNVLDFISNYLKEGIRYVISTDIDKDGMLIGPSFELYKEILALENVKLIASGGVTTIEDLVALKVIGCAGAIVGKAIYEGHISLKELAKLC